MKGIRIETPRKTNEPKAGPLMRPTKSITAGDRRRERDECATTGHRHRVRQTDGAAASPRAPTRRPPGYSRRSGQTPRNSRPTKTNSRRNRKSLTSQDTDSVTKRLAVQTSPGLTAPITPVSNGGERAAATSTSSHKALVPRWLLRPGRTLLETGARAQCRGHGEPQASDRADPKSPPPPRRASPSPGATRPADPRRDAPATLNCYWGCSGHRHGKHCPS